MRRVLLVLALVVVSSTASAEDGHWGISIWGLSYHVNRDADYNELNWGLGVRYYARPDWWWLGTSRDNRVFLEVDALRNSNRGLAVPASAGVEFKIAPLPGRCRLLAVGALTVAYYQYPQKDSADIKVGPVPGLGVGCGRVTTNMTAVLRRDSEPLAALSLSMTVAF